MLAAALFVTVTGWLLASPPDEIKQAVSVTGTGNVKNAAPDAFLDAFSSVLVGVDQSKSAAYVSAAQQLRPDLKEDINVVAAEVASGSADTDDDRHRVSRHRRRCTICLNNHTLHLPCNAARHHLEHHPHDYRGPCTPTPAPAPHH
jgi:hypothetical protein